jgi:pimeloyl-ACP methyl ester carboxylesterase
MTPTISRRQLFHVGGSALAMLGFSNRSDAGSAMSAQSLPVRALRDDYQEDHFYREDWLGEPWRRPEPVVLIHGNDESSIEWYAWVPRMAQEYRLIRPDLPGLGHSTIPRGFEYSLANLAMFVTQVMDKAGIESAHIIGAKTGGAVAMRLAADHPKRTRTLVVVGGPASPLAIADPSPVPQRDRLGSNVSKEMIAYWNTLFSHPDREGVKGLSRSLSNFDLAKEGVLQRITAPTLVITADRSKMHSVEKARTYQVQIPNSRLVVIRSDAYHIAAANADECVSHTLAFLKEQTR